MGISIGGGGGEELNSFGALNNLNSRIPFISSPSSPLISSSTSSSILLAPSLKTSYPQVSRSNCEDDDDDEYEWVSVDRESDVIVTDKAPEIDEVEDAFSALQLMFNDVEEDSEEQVSDLGLVEDWIEPPLHLCNTRLLQPYMLDRLYDAFHLFHTDPSVQRMVMSLASDKAVWDAVMCNEVVRELITNAEKSEDDSGCPAASFIRKLVTKSAIKIIDAMERVTKYVTDIFNVVPGDETVVLASGPASVMEKLQLTVLLAVVVLLVVLVTRATRGR